MNGDIKERGDSLVLFLNEAKNLFPILEIKENIRATHRGLFVSEKYSDNVSKVYSSWLEKQTSGEIHKSEEKSKKRLFGAGDPESFYLIEGKNCISGHLIHFELKEPQKLGLPYYLGSLSSKREYLHPNDPVLASLKDVEIMAQAGGAGIKIKMGQQYFNAESGVVRYFVNVALNSHRTLQEFPEISDSLGVQCKAFVILFRKSKIIPARELLLVPEAYKYEKKYFFRIIGNIVFVSDEKHNIVSVYGLKGKDLYKLIRREFHSVRKRHIGSFEIFSDKDKLLGCFTGSEKKYKLNTQAYMDFISSFSGSPDKKDKLDGALTALRLFERYADIFQTSQPINKKLVMSHFKDYHKPILDCRINGVWIFLITKDFVIDATVPKFL